VRLPESDNLANKDEVDKEVTSPNNQSYDMHVPYSAITLFIIEEVLSFTAE
jgi:hypothetical protein